MLFYCLPKIFQLKHLQKKIEYSYKGQSRIETVPEWNRFTQSEIPEFNEQALSNQIERYRKQYQHMYVVLSYDQGYEDRLAFYLDNNLERIDLKELSENLEIRVYRLRYDI